MARYLKWFSYLLVPALFGAALWAIARELREFRPHEVMAAIDALSLESLVRAGWLTVASYVLLTGYDWCGLAYAGRRLAYRRVAFTSFAANIFSYNVGLSVLGGAAVRYRLYASWGLSPMDVGKVVLFCTATFWLGIVSALGVVLVAGQLPAVGLSLTPLALRFAGGALLAAVAAYLIACRWWRRPVRLGGWDLELPGPRLAAAQVGLSVLDLVLAGTVLYVLLPPGAVSFPVFLGVYLTAIATGVISHVPGGLGVFETVMLMLLPPGMPRPDLIAVLVAYRAIYYVVPFTIGLVLVTAYSLRSHRRRMAGLARVVSKGVRVVSPPGLTLAVFLGGVVLLASGATPSVHSRLAILRQILPLGVLEVSHFLGSVAGVGLLFLARGLQLRLNAAWGATIAVLVAGAVFSLGKAVDFEEALILLAMAAALAVSRRHFHRRSSLWDHRFSPEWLVAIALVLAGTTWLGFFAYKHVEYSNDLWWTFGFRHEAPRFLRASVGVAAVVAAVGLARLLRPLRQRLARPVPEDLAIAAAIAATAPASTAQLVTLGDKAVILSASRRSFLMYGVAGRSWVAMGDPVGDPDEAEELVWEFRERCDEAGAWTVFYEVTPERIPLYLDLGLSLFKLGESARVKLPGFSLEGSARKNLRQTQARAEREGCAFDVWAPAEVRARLEELQAVSDAWLASKHTREKGFSLGFYSPEFVCRYPAAVVHCGGKLVAFATIWRSGGHEELSVDLMRQRPEAPPGAMEYLFVRLMQWGAAEGFRWFDLGMAPFSGIENHPLAPLWNRFGALLFRQGETFYNFQGLRRYKDKFAPVWQPRYLACPGGLILPQVFANVGALVSGGLTGLVRK